jgi:hypothetical protein
MGNVETVLQITHDEGEDKIHPSTPYGLRRIFSNPVAAAATRREETSLLHQEEVVQEKPYGLRRIFSNPHDREIDTGVALTKTKSYHHPSRLDPPLSLVRRVSRLRSEKRDDGSVTTVDESVESSTSSVASTKRRSKKWALLFTALGMLGAVGYITYNATRGEKSRLHSSSLESFSSSESMNDVFGNEQDPADPSSVDESLLISDASFESVSPTYVPTLSPLESPTIHPITESPTESPTHRPTPRPSYRPSPRPSQDTKLIFYVMADAPYTDNERDEVMPNVIDELPDDAKMLFHLGDLEFKKVDNCEEWAYQEASRILERSSVPVFVLPGDNDLNGE